MNGFLLDTNIPSELLRPRPNVTVAAWLRKQPRPSLFVSVISIGELRKGISLLEPGEKRVRIEQAIATLIPGWFSKRILPVTQAIAERWGLLEAERQRSGRPISVADGLIAATSLTHNLTLVTRNAKDFEGLGLHLLNPWDDVP